MSLLLGQGASQAALIGLAALQLAATEPEPLVLVSDGRGEMRVGGETYPIGGLTWILGANRGALRFEGGADGFTLAGGASTRVDATHLILKVDAVRVITTHRADVLCKVQTSTGGRAYLAVSCKGAIGDAGPVIRLNWTGNGQDARREPQTARPTAL